MNNRELSEGIYFLGSFTELEIGNYCKLMTITPTAMCWPLRNLDLCLIRVLSPDGSNFPRRVVFTLIDLFVDQFFVNHVKLSLEGIDSS